MPPPPPPSPPATNANTLHLVDATSNIYRAHWTTGDLALADGTRIGAVFGFANQLLKLLREEQPTHVALVFDAGRRSFRTEIFPEYKANRSAADPEMVRQIPIIDEMIGLLGVPTLKLPGWEADDVLATLTRQARDQAWEVVLFTGDKDMLQLVGPGVRVIDPIRNRRVGPQDVQALMGVPHDRLVELQALMGDDIDNVPGVKGVGPKWAADLVNRWGTVEEILAHVDEIKHKTVREALRAQADTARLSRRLVELHVDAPVTFEPSRFAYGLGPAQWGARVRDFFRRLEMNTIVRTLDAAAPVARIDRGAYRLVTDLDGVRSVAARARETGTLALDLVTATDDPVAPALCGVALAAAPGEAVYVPFAHRGLHAVPQLRAEDVLAALAPLLEDAAVAKDLPRAKQTLRILEGTHDADAASAAPSAASAAVPAPAPAREPRDLLDLMAPLAPAPAPVPAATGPLALRGLRGDPGLLGFLLDTSRDGSDLVALSRKELDHSALALEDVLGKGTRGRAPTPEDLAPADLLPWAGEQVDLALRLTAKLLPAVNADADLRRLYEELELPLCAVLARLERRGVLVDVARLDALAAEFQQRMNVLQEECWAIAGEPFNPGSTPQLRHVLFEKLGLAPGRRTKTGFSTDQSVLEELDHPIAEKLLLLRKLTKLKNTYLDVLPKLVNARTGRVHTTFNQTGAATGRLSSDNPNLQNIPVRDEEGKRIREAFHAAPGWRLVSADYSQIELRLLAHLSADDALLAAFRSGEDIHRATAAEVLGVARDAVTREQRDAAKAVNFGIMYGISSFGLARQLGVGQAEAQRFIDRYRARYGGIQRWIERTLAEARRTGEVRTLQGRRRRISNLGARQRPLREGAERQAINTPIQGSAADVMKAAMIAVERALGAELPAARMLLTVHDELLIEAPEADAARAAAVARREMEAVLKLDPPLVVDTGTGRTWLEAH